MIMNQSLDNPPKSFRVNGCDVPIYWVSSDDELSSVIPDKELGDCSGYAVTYPKLAVVVDRTFLETDPQLAQMTLLHEILHIVSDLNGIGLSEKQVLGLEAGLFGVAKDNPEVAKFLFGD
tara:strand:- start:121 stop:480 length:360 start_codon:yes stop_codon:yes gene_type:complete